MKRVLILLTAMFLVSGALTKVLANEVSIFGGTPIPHGQTEGGLYGQKAGGWQFGAQYNMPLREALSFYLEAAYGHIPNAEDLDWLSPMKMLEGAAVFKIRTCDRLDIQPYILMGLGLAEYNILVDVEETDTHLTSSSTEMTVRLGGGLDYLVSDSLGIFAEGMVQESFYVSLIPVRAGVRLAL